MGRDERLARLAFPLLYGKILFLGQCRSRVPLARHGIR
jgi:hypothetical protein